MQKKYIFVFILSFLFFIQTLPVSAQGLQCIYCRTALNYNNFGAKTDRGYLCKNCCAKFNNGANRQQQAQPRQQQGQQPYICSSCGQVIRGKGSTDGTHYYCAACMSKIQGSDVLKGELICDKCHRKIGPTEQYAKGRDYRGNNVIYCVPCAQQSGLSKTIKCVKCNQVIQGAGYKSERDQYGNFIYTCAKCATGNNGFKSESKCAVCGKGIGDYASQKANGGGYSFQYFTTKNNVPYCMECKEKYKDTCKTCGLPIPPNGGVRNGSYLTCTACSKDIVVTDSQLKQLYAQACAFMRDHFGLTVPVTPDKVYFSDMSEMSKAVISSRDEDVPRTYGQNAVGLFSRTGNDLSIRVQKGMPKLEILETLVHEGAHACMSEFGYNQKASLMYSEGFAEWCAYKFLTSIGETQYYYQKSKRKDRIYGEGLRKMLELEKKLNANGLLQYVCTHNDFPQE